MIQPLKTMLLLCLLLSLTPVESGSEAEIIKALEETQQEVAWKYIPLSGPSIDKSFSKNVTAQIGKTAILNCRIKYLGGKTVSWMRARDLHLLTVGRFTYTSDERFRAVHQTGSDDWLLKIHYAQHRDAGAYECQVSTTPPLSTSVYLAVVNEPETQVLGGPDLYINAGSTINLTCVVSHSADPPPYIFWYHQSELLSYDSPRGGITVVTEHGPTSSSRLLIQRATSKDAGQYACRPANAEPHHINVHIIPNEHPAAIHHKNGTSESLSIHQESSSYYSILLSLIFTLVTLSPNLLLFCGFAGAHRHSKKPIVSTNKEDYQVYTHETNNQPVSTRQKKKPQQAAGIHLRRKSKPVEGPSRCKIPMEGKSRETSYGDDDDDDDDDDDVSIHPSRNGHHASHHNNSTSSFHTFILPPNLSHSFAALPGSHTHPHHCHNLQISPRPTIRNYILKS